VNIGGDYVARHGCEIVRATILLIGCLLLAVTGMGSPGIADDLAAAPAVPGQPQIPHSFYGTIEAAGGPVPAGVPVEARSEGVFSGIPGNPVYSHAGGYGSEDPFKPRLEVQGTLPGGSILTFYVGGVQAEVQAGGSTDPWSTTYRFSPGSVTELNMRVAAMVTPDPAYQETAEPSAHTTPATVPRAGTVNPSTEMMFGLIAILVILAILAFYFGKRAKESGNESKQESGGGKDGPGNE
jgi:hypothetical protein